MKFLKRDSQQTKLYIDYSIYLLGILVISAAHYTLLNLQSSLNVQDGLGSIAMTAQYAAMLTGALFASTNVLHFIDIKTGMLIADVFYITIIVANYYPTFYTLIPANIFGGFGKSLFFITSGGYNVYFAKHMEKLGTRSYKDCVGDITALTLCSIQLAQIIGNLIPYIIFETAPVGGGDNSNNGTTTETSVTQTPLKISDICAANDCQDPEITDRTINNYKPLDDITLYVMMSVFLALNISGFLLHMIYAPRSTHDYSKRQTKERPVPEINLGFKTNEESDQREKTDIPPNETDENDNLFSNFNLQEAWKESKANLFHFVQLQQLLLAGLVFHQGMIAAFAIGELTRAYVSCVFGVSEVGLSMSFFGIAALLISLCYGRILGKVKRFVPLIGFVLINAGCITFALLWVPNEYSQVWEVYLLLAVAGLSGGSASTLTSYFVPVFFPNVTRRAFSSWAAWTAIGNLVQYAWSTSVCVRYKIYTLYVIAEVRNKKKASTASIEESNTEICTKF